MSALGEMEEVVRKLVGLGMWDALANCKWAAKPHGTAVPYFCTVLKSQPGDPVKLRFVMLEGWQTLHDFVRLGVDPSLGFYSSPMEMKSYVLAVLADGGFKVFAHEPGYVPREIGDEKGAAICAKILWQAYGLMLRLEGDPQSALAYMDQKAIFARFEKAGGEWEDGPLAIPEPVPLVERITFPNDLLAKAKDMPMTPDAKVSVDFRMVPSLMTNEPRPRSVYRLSVRRLPDGFNVEEHASVVGELGLKGLWESVPPRVLTVLVREGCIPGEMHMTSKRRFRLMRPIMLQLPIKLCLHDEVSH